MDAIETRIREVCLVVDIDHEQVLRVVRALMAQGYPKPCINPTPEGLVELEWQDGLSVEIHTMPGGWLAELDAIRKAN